MAAVFGASFVLLVRVVDPRSPWLGLLPMFYFMGLAREAEPLFMLPFPRALQTVETTLASDARYRRLGVRGFGNLLRHTPLRHLNGSVYLANGERSIDESVVQMKSAEAIHFWAAVLFAPYIVYVLSRGLVAVTASFVLVQVIFNVYPILHLRMTRARLGRVSGAIRTRRGASRN